jgi:acetyl esterase
MDPQVQILLQMVEAQRANTAPIWETPVAETRVRMETVFAAYNAGAPEIGSIENRKIPGPAGDIPVKIFTPKGEGPFPLVVYLHGGGWVMFSPTTHQKLCAELVDGAGVVIVSVDYRMAPENVPPAALEDCVAAIRWSVENAANLNADASRFAIGGDSAGANLTVASAMKLRDEGGPRARMLLLFYGGFDLNFDSPSCRENTGADLITLEWANWSRDQYLSGGADITDPFISPMFGDLSGLPAAHLIVGTLDILFDDSKRLAVKFEEAGVPATLSVYQDMPHGFVQLTGFLDVAKTAVGEASAALRAALA